MVVSAAGSCDAAASQAGCLENLPASCDPLYSPVFDKIHGVTIAPKCALAGGSCHASEGAQGGLVLDGGADAAYAALLGTGSGESRVLPGDPACSLLISRLDAPAAAQVMPPGAQLHEAERCAIRQWIEAGAAR